MLILFREYNSSGRNICRINGQTVTLSMLRRIGECLVDVHGQHDNHSLLSSSTHIKLLDLFAGGEMQNLKNKYTDGYNELHRIEAELEELSGDPEKRAVAIDLLRFQIDEIGEAALKVGEDEELERRRTVLANAEKIADCLENSYIKLMTGGSYGTGTKPVSDILGELCSEMGEISEFKDSYADILSKINEATYILEDAAEQIRCEKDEDFYDRREADDIERRLDEIYGLKRKYGDTIEDINAFAEDASAKLLKLESGAERCEELTLKRERTVKELLRLSSLMNKLRESAAKRLEAGIRTALSDMEMDKVDFRVGIEYSGELTETGRPPKFGKNGLDSVEFIISTNPGEPFKPLSKIASGGELSRIMLAIKSVLADIDDIPVLIFDEIDTGISGYAATKVAEKFKNISGSHQVICVSHLAQIAAIADNNVFVSKRYSDESVTTNAEMLDGEGKIREVGRLLDGGDFSETARKHAVELIKRLRA